MMPGYTDDRRSFFHEFSVGLTRTLSGRDDSHSTLPVGLGRALVPGLFFVRFLVVAACASR